MDIPIIAGCDANAHYVLWRSTDNNYRGIELVDDLSRDLEIKKRAANQRLSLTLGKKFR